VLDHVERRRFLVQPAGKNPPPFLVRPLDVDLDESPGKLLGFPRRGRLAGAEADDHVLPSRRLAGVKRHILDNSIALVEDSDDRHPLRHRSDPRLVRLHRGSPGIGLGIALLAAAPAGAKRQHQARRDRQR
jgi:hypothetical protein